jgi:hypothetical protein
MTKMQKKRIKFVGQSLVEARFSKAEMGGDPGLEQKKMRDLALGSLGRMAISANASPGPAPANKTAPIARPLRLC